MVAIFALILAVVATLMAANARRELDELRARLDRSDRDAALKGAPARDATEAAPQPGPQPVPAPPTRPAAPPPPTPGSTHEPPPPPPPPPPPRPVFEAAAREGSRPALNIDWEHLIGIKLFSRIGAVALVLAVVFLFKYSVEQGWLRPAIRATFGLAIGAGLLVLCELRVARNYRLTANAMDGAGIAILYATLFALHARWNLWPVTAAFLGMLAVTAVAVLLSTRRDSVFIALLGLVGGFSTPALLSSGENRPIELFSYLLLLNGGIAWIAFRKRWPLLTALSIGLTVFYQWAWVERFLTTGQLPLAAAIFLAFAAVAASSLWPRNDDPSQPAFRSIAGAGAVLPLLFAFFTAVVPEYGARFNVLFGFLLLICAGLAAITLWRGAAWLHALGGAAALLTFFIWLVVSYTPESWPASLLWLAAFVALYLGAEIVERSVAVYTAPLLFFVFVGLALGEPQRYAPITGALFALLAVLLAFAAWSGGVLPGQGLPGKAGAPRALRSRAVAVAAIGLALASIAVMNLPSPALLYVASQTAIFTILLAAAFLTRRHRLAAAAIPFSVAGYLAASHLADAQQLAFGAILYALFLAYPALLGARVGRSAVPHAVAAATSAVFFLEAYAAREVLGYTTYIGVLPVAQSLLLLALLAQLLRFEPQPQRLAFVGGAALAFLTIAVPVQLDGPWVAIAWAIEALALAWLFTRVAHRGLLFWSAGLAAVILTLLANEPRFDGYAITYAVIAAATFGVAWFAAPLRPIASTIATVELFMLLNVAIGDSYSDAAASALARDLTYTMGWALFAIAMLVAGIALQSRAARVAALGLLAVTILKCFLYDLAQLGGLYRVASLFGLAVSLVLVGLMLQKFVMMRRAAPDA